MNIQTLEVFSKKYSGNHIKNTHQFDELTFSSKKSYLINKQKLLAFSIIWLELNIYHSKLI